MLDTAIEAKPFLKWAGGKRQLLEQFKSEYPEALKNNEIKVYIEPFVGGGAVFFELIKYYDFEKVVLNDVNQELINTYKAVKREANAVIKRLKEMESEYLPLDIVQRKDIYYLRRDNFNDEKKELNFDEFTEAHIEHAAKFIFLNRTCFNGLYRQNKSGEFNVPIGRYKNPTICNEENLLEVSESLKNVILISKDFEKTAKYIEEQTFIYVDPPYRPLPGTKSFTKYAKADFNEASQIRLAEWANNIKEKAYLMLSNSNPKNTDPEDDFFEKLYSNFSILEVSAKRSINSNASKRGKITELLIKNY
jgi:DNA adenine methylase